MRVLSYFEQAGDLDCSVVTAFPAGPVRFGPARVARQEQRGEGPIDLEELVFPLALPFGG